MKVDADYELMRDIEARYNEATGLRDRAYYSIFYGPLRKSKFLMLNANPGGRPDSYQIVDVFAGQHEYIEGRNSGPTTRNGAEILLHICGGTNPEALRGVQVLNRFFRRSPSVEKRTECAYMEEARPFLAELIEYIEPEAILFGGDSSVATFAQVHKAAMRGAPVVRGPNGTNEAVYFGEYELALPYYRRVQAFSIYHPSKLNGVFRDRVFPLLRDRLGRLVANGVAA